jgi:CubicO group peptidase (beta-lactamase class C family)
MSAVRGPEDLASRIDAIMAPFASDQPGAAVIVVKGGRVLFRKAYGLANLETQTPMRPEMVFEIGSITKQFTSTAILMLEEQGKLALADDVRKYVPQFPDKGAPITIEHLLTHTSGIKDYTEDPKWPALWRQDLTPAQVLDLVKDAPLDFPPGTKWRYDNTGYTLLGMILEKASGMAYAEFIQSNIFEPLGMAHSLYGSLSAIVPHRAAGYTKGEKQWENAPYLSMAQPYAAGSLMSSVDDLALWDAAVSSGRLISPVSWRKALTGHRLPDGEETRYGFGWQLGSYQGHAVIHHGGGIPGYVTEVFRMPADHLYVAVLTNSDSPSIDPDTAAAKIAAEAIDRPYHDPAAITLATEVLDSYVGIYQIDPENTRTISRDGTHMFMQRTGGRKLEIFPVRSGEFFLANSFQRLSFTQDGTGKIVRIVSRWLDGPPDIGERILSKGKG